MVIEGSRSYMKVELRVGFKGILMHTFHTLVIRYQIFCCSEFTHKLCSEPAIQRKSP